MAERITDRLWRVGGGTWLGTVNALSGEDDANVYVLRGPRRPALVDCGTLASRPRIEANLHGAGVAPGELRELLLTHSHWDHTDAAHAWQAAHGLRTHLSAVGADRLDRGDLRLVGAALHGPGYAYAPFTVDHRVHDGETFDLAGVAVTARALPGHTPDSTLYTFALDGERVGVCGDVAFGPNEAGTHSLGLLSNLWASDLDDYVQSLRALERIPLDLLVPGHGAPVAGRSAVREAIAGTLAVAERLAGDPDVRRNTGC